MIKPGTKEHLLPSMLRGATGRHDSVSQRINVVKEYSEKLGLFAPEEFKNDEHYWLTVMTRTHVVNGYLRNIIKGGDQLKITSLSLSMNEAEEFMKLEKLKVTDGLTKAWSRTALDNFLENLRIKPRKDVKTGILLLDIDHFKEYNDMNGHPGGDEMLINLVKLMKINTRSTDMVGRYGGEEFAAIVTNLPREASAEIIEGKAEVLRKEIEKKLGITVSIGTTVIMDSDQDITDIYKRVDKHLYEAKSSGRNIVSSDNGLVEKNKYV